ncbi:hypothetical protein N9Q68_01620, partial [Polaribacter sp.]|nr:hypothetical protein [Polaribacter sp.]
NLGKSGPLYSLANSEEIIFTLSNVLNSSTKVEFDLNGVKQTLVIDAGNSRAVFILPITLGETSTIELTSAIGLYNNVSLGDKTAVSFLGLPTPSPDSIEALAFNETGADNFWFGLSSFTSGGDWVTDYNQNSAFGHPRPMSIPLNGAGNMSAIPNSDDVAPNYIALNLYTFGTIPNPTGFTVYLVMPDGSFQVFEGFVPSDIGLDNPVVSVKVEDDSVNAGMKIYTFTEL